MVHLQATIIVSNSIAQSIQCQMFCWHGFWYRGTKTTGSNPTIQPCLHQLDCSIGWLRLIEALHTWPRLFQKFSIKSQRARFSFFALNFSVAMGLYLRLDFTLFVSPFSKRSICAETLVSSETESQRVTFSVLNRHGFEFRIGLDASTLNKYRGYGVMDSALAFCAGSPGLNPVIVKSNVQYSDAVSPNWYKLVAQRNLRYLASPYSFNDNHITSHAIDWQT